MTGKARNTGTNAKMWGVPVRGKQGSVVLFFITRAGAGIVPLCRGRIKNKSMPIKKDTTLHPGRQVAQQTYVCKSQFVFSSVPQGSLLYLY